MDRDPQMAQMLNNPELLRESLNMMANPVSAPTRQQPRTHPICRPTAFAAARRHEAEEADSASPACTGITPCQHSAAFML